jgi:hypothetical protein
LSQSDPTDHALAAIASILDQPASPAPSGLEPEPEKVVVPERPAISGPIEADGYAKFGPGPMETIRFKWTVRREDEGRYFVDETIGENSRPITSGPMAADEATKFVDDREREARLRFEQLKSAMARAPLPTPTTRRDGSEI